MVSVEEVARFGRIDIVSDQVKQELEELILVAQSYLKTATGRDFKVDDKVAVLYLKRWVVAQYDGNFEDEKVQHSLRLLLVQLQYGRGDNS